MEHDLTTFEGRAAYINQCERELIEQRIADARRKFEQDMWELQLRIALDQYIAALNAPLEIFKLELQHGVSLMPRRKR